MCKKALFAVDLDNTLIHSYKTAKETDVCVEAMMTDDNKIKKLSYMTPTAYNMFRDFLKGRYFFCPVTTRSLSQYKRIFMFDENVPPFALCSNGGILLKNGVVDNEWHRESVELIKSSVDEMKKGMDIMQTHRTRTFEVRFVDELFVFTKSSDPVSLTDILRKNLDSKKVSVHYNLSKVYIIPKCLTKQDSIERLCNKYGFDKVITAGDSDFDIPMLVNADYCFVPDKNLLNGYTPNGTVIEWSDKNISYAEFIFNKMNYMDIY